MSTVITNDEALQNVAYNLNRVLKKKKVTQAALARKTGDSQPVINCLCNAKYLPSIALTARIAAALKIEIEDLLQPIPKQAIPPLPDNSEKFSENFSRST